jgi:Fur family transcriptional regulator, zinc uptake regulator
MFIARIAVATMANMNVLTYADNKLFKKVQKWTPNRRMVFDALAEQSKPITAYQLLELLHAKSGQRIDPPTVYRALGFLQEMGLVMKLEGLNAFLMCKENDHSENHVFFICNSCGNADEHCNDKVTSNLMKTALQNGFKPSRQIVELHGQCLNCQK